jgi:hypothetical protein
MTMLPKEKILASRLSIAMHDWPVESRKNMIEWVTDALREQREDEREACARIADGTPSSVGAASHIANEIRARASHGGG